MPEFEGKPKTQIADARIEMFFNSVMGAALQQRLSDAEIVAILASMVGRMIGLAKPGIDQLEVISNTNPRNNYFRVEEFIHGNISFVDGLGCNSGYFLVENLYSGSTTAAHEYGHTIGLDHPKYLDIRGNGVPGIMYPRGTLVDAEFQYDPTLPAGVTGGTMHPMNRRVRQEDIDNLRIEKLNFVNRKAILGWFTNVYHWNHVPGSIEK